LLIEISNPYPAIAGLISLLEKHMLIAGIDDVVEATRNTLLEDGVDLPKTKIKAVLQAGFGAVESLASTETTVRIRGLGSFVVKERAERQGRNPQTGDAITIAATSHLHFKQSKAAK
jgi:nucleoid DNA-binding protein